MPCRISKGTRWDYGEAVRLAIMILFSPGIMSWFVYYFSPKTNKQTKKAKKLVSYFFTEKVLKQNDF
jgi:hypothetical protein